VRNNIELPALLDGRVRGGEVSRRADALMTALDIATQAAKLRHSFPAGSASAWRLRARSSISLTFSWPTSRLATWTRPAERSVAAVQIAKRAGADDRVGNARFGRCRTRRARCLYSRWQITGEGAGLDAATIAYRISHITVRPSQTDDLSIAQNE